MSYRIALTSGNIRSLDWASQRGYFPDDWTCDINYLSSEDERDIYEVPENVAWELIQFRDEDEHSFLSCMPDDVCQAVWDLIEQVV